MSVVLDVAAIHLYLSQKCEAGFEHRQIQPHPMRLNDLLRRVKQ